MFFWTFLMFELGTTSQPAEEFLQVERGYVCQKHPVHVAHSHVTSNNYG